MKCVRDAIAGSQRFMGNASFDPWVNICSAEQSAFERRYMELFTAHLARKKENSYQQLRDANRRGQEARSTSDVESSAAMRAGSASSSDVGDTTANVVSSFDHGKERKISSLASLLGRKKHDKDVEPSVSK